MPYSRSKLSAGPEVPPPVCLCCLSHPSPSWRPSLSHGPFAYKVSSTGSTIPFSSLLVDTCSSSKVSQGSPSSHQTSSPCPPMNTTSSCTILWETQQVKVGSLGASACFNSWCKHSLPDWPWLGLLNLLRSQLL